MKRHDKHGITIEFINAPKDGVKLKAPGQWLDALIATAKANKAKRIIVVFDREPIP